MITPRSEPIVNERGERVFGVSEGSTGAPQSVLRYPEMCAFRMQSRRSVFSWRCGDLSRGVLESNVDSAANRHN
jgi:hypothetical protein